MAEQAEQTLAAFLTDSGAAARRFLTEVQRIDKADDNVKIVDAAVVDRTKRGRIKVHQTEDTGALKGGVRGAAIGVVVGTIVLGPAGPIVGGVLGGTLGGLHNRFRDVGIDDKFMRSAAQEIDNGKSALFVLYEGNWSGSIGAIQDLVKAENALLIHSTLTAEKAEALQALVAPAVEELGGEEAVADYEVDAPETVEGTEPLPEAGAAQADAATEGAAPAEPEAPTPEGDDLTRIKGIGPKTAAVLTGAGVDSYARLASTSEPDLRRVFSDAKTAVPRSVNTWAMQASFAAKGDWPGLDAFTRKSQPEAEAKAEPVEAAAHPPKPDDLTQLNGIGPKAAEALVKAGITTYGALAEANEPQLRHALHAADMMPPAGLGTWPMQASYVARGDFQGLMKYNEKRTRPTTAKPGATTAEPVQAASPDDLTQLKGIGPRVASLLSDYGVTTYADLQHTSTGDLREIVAMGGALPPASLDTWPTQASYAVKGDWQGLATYNRGHR
jgi:predicted flap endonuclease-1-like 5' DNA nuclease